MDRPDLNINFELESFFQIKVFSKSGELRKELPWTKNLILDQGLQYLRGSGRPFPNCHVGSSSSPPLSTQTTLVSPVAVSSTGSASVTSANVAEGYYQISTGYRFEEGVAQGNLSEIGCGQSNGNLYARALIRDASGNPTTITVLSDEVLIVSWAHRRYWPTVDLTGSLANSGNKGGTFDWISRAANISQWTVGSTDKLSCGILITSIAGVSNGGYSGSAMGPITGQPSLISTSGSTVTGVSAEPGVNASLARFSFTSGSRTIKSAIVNFNGLQFQIEFTPAIVMTNDDVANFVIGCSWGRR